MHRTLIRSAAPGMALLTLGLLASAVVQLGSGPVLADKPSSAAKTLAANKPQGVENYGKLPLSFEANQGQTDSRVDFLSRGSGYTLFLTPAEAVLSFPSRDRKGAGASPSPSGPSLPEGRTVLRMQLVGANPHPEVSGLEELPGKTTTSSKTT